MSEPLFSKQVQLAHPENAPLIFGVHDRHLELMESIFAVKIAARGEIAEISGDQAAVDQVVELIETLEEALFAGKTLSERDVILAVNMAEQGKLTQFAHLYDEPIGKTYDQQPIRAKTHGQKRYIDAIKKHAVTFGIGPAGTGKTFLAVVMAVRALQKGEVKRIILTRPAVEAGENLGFLPGDLKEKVDPYLRPVYDALYAIYGTEHTERLIERNVIEIAPLAYMRGRTLEDAFVILDEAQNTTIAQMKMFLTRLGFGSRMIVNGDASQIDLPRGVRSGLRDATYKLAGLSDVAFVTFDAGDVVRHPVVSAIIKAYETPTTTSSDEAMNKYRLATNRKEHEC
ncbi:MAG: PhoH family protein [Aerococcus sp.]|nr:PhoH family protein [Aerococcus sp.]